jgi:hypothetical protein
VAKYFFSISEQEKDGFKTVQFFVFSLRKGPITNGPTCKLESWLEIYLGWPHPDAEVAGTHRVIPG